MKLLFFIFLIFNLFNNNLCLSKTLPITKTLPNLSNKNKFIYQYEISKLQIQLNEKNKLISSYISELQSMYNENEICNTQLKYFIDQQQQYQYSSLYDEYNLY